MTLKNLPIEQIFLNPIEQKMVKQDTITDGIKTRSKTSYSKPAVRIPPKSRQSDSKADTGTSMRPPSTQHASSPRKRTHVGRRRETETAFCGVIKGGRPLSKEEGQYHHPEAMDSSGNPTGVCIHGHRIPLYCDFPVFAEEGVQLIAYAGTRAPRMAFATKAARKSSL